MLSEHSMAIRAFDDGEGFHCRGCTVKAIGEAAVQRLEAGLSRRIGRWSAASRYEVDESAVHWGYELGEQCEDPEHAKLREDPELMETRGEGYCPGCDRYACFTCGEVRLDTTPEQDAEYERRMAAAGRVAW